MKNYSEKIDKIFGVTNYKHRTLRTLFDPYSQEWEATTMDEKITILKRITDASEDISKLVIEYRAYYQEFKKPDVSKDAYLGLATLLQYLLTPKLP